MRSKYVIRKNGEIRKLNPQKSIDKIACCDCGLIHTVEYTVGHRQKLTIKIWRDQRATGQRRRWQRISFKKNK